LGDAGKTGAPLRLAVGTHHRRGAGPRAMGAVGRLANCPVGPI